jgi:hypothetical protein
MIRSDDTESSQELAIYSVADQPSQESVTASSLPNISISAVAAPYGDDILATDMDLILGQDLLSIHHTDLFESDDATYTDANILNGDLAPDWTLDQLGGIVDMWAADDTVFDEFYANMTHPLPLGVPGSALPADGPVDRTTEVCEGAALSHTAVASMYPSQGEIYSLLYDKGLDEATLAAAEDFGHISLDLSISYSAIRSLFDHQAFSKDHQFPSHPVFRAFCELYFEYFDYQFPFLHPSSLVNSESCYVSVLAMAVIGAEYSAIGKRDIYRSTLFDLLPSAITINVSR